MRSGRVPADRLGSSRIPVTETLSPDQMQHHVAPVRAVPATFARSRHDGALATPERVPMVGRRQSE